MKIRTTTKILLLLTLCMVSINSRCFRPAANTGCNYDYCCTYGPNNSPFTAIYNDGYRYRGSIGLNGVGTYPLRGQSCATIAVINGNNFGFALSAAPDGADLNAPPSSVAITGPGGIDGTYGMPMVEYFDSNGYYVGSVYATATSGSTWLTAPTPDLSSVYSGTYQVRVTNLRSDGEYLDIVGSANLNCWGRDRPDSDGDGWYDDEDCYPYDPYYWSCSDPGPGDGGGCNNTGGIQMECYVY
jgi:hypothetical protein